MQVNKRTLKYSILVLFILCTSIVFGQDVQLSQFYAAQTFLNPAYAGGAHAHRAMFHQRLQWPGSNWPNDSLNAKYMTSLFSYDAFSNKYRSGYGIMLLYDNLGGSTYTNTELHFQYSYELPVSKNLTFRPGLQVGMVSRGLNYTELTFPHQYNDNGYIPGSSTNGYNWGAARKLYPDIGAGLVGYTDNLWFSVSGNHLNLPNQSVIGGVARLPMKFAFALGHKIHLKERRHMAAYATGDEEVSFTPVVHYKFQGKSDQLDVGTYFIYNQLMAGLWYRGIPVKRYESKFQNNESLILLVGWMYGNWSISYSYDFTLSRLRPASTRGAHEINLTYIHHPRKRHKVRKRLPCPSFYNNHL